MGRSVYLETAEMYRTSTDHTPWRMPVSSGILDAVSPPVPKYHNTGFKHTGGDSLDVPQSVLLVFGFSFFSRRWGCVVEGWLRNWVGPEGSEVQVG